MKSWNLLWEEEVLLQPEIQWIGHLSLRVWYRALQNWHLFNYKKCLNAINFVGDISKNARCAVLLIGDTYLFISFKKKKKTQGQFVIQWRFLEWFPE